MVADLRVAVIDDDVVSRAYIRRALAIFPRVLVVEFDRVAGFVQDHEGGTRYDCVILDHMMPQQVGLDLVAPLVQLGVPVVFETAWEAAAHDARERGAFHVLVKPYGLEELREAVRDALALPPHEGATP